MRNEETWILSHEIPQMGIWTCSPTPGLIQPFTTPPLSSHHVLYVGQQGKNYAEIIYFSCSQLCVNVLPSENFIPVVEPVLCWMLDTHWWVREHPCRAAVWSRLLGSSALVFHSFPSSGWYRTDGGWSYSPSYSSRYRSYQILDLSSHLPPNPLTPFVFVFYFLEWGS